MRINLNGPGAACVLLLSGTLVAPPPASTADPPSRCAAEVARAVEEQLAKAPQARFIPPDTLSYGDGSEVITFRPPSCGPARRSAERDCDGDGVLDNAVCLYDRRAFEGSRQAIKATGARRLNWTGVIMSIRNDRPFVFLVKKSRGDDGACFPSGEGYGNVSDISEQRWVNAHPSLRRCP
ncbi:hypothetical protein [Streptosporangium sp. NPDC006007]|uniref:hypothetical protein n=1 Tax=Streptosporangium sp. NPDC006007 TaxID=3154575 RepID=UPI0033A7B582